MFYFDLIIIIISAIQPLIIGFLVLLSIKNYFYNFFFLNIIIICELKQLQQNYTSAQLIQNLQRNIHIIFIH